MAGKMYFHILKFPYFHIFDCGSSSFGRAIAFQAIGGEFEPRLPLGIRQKRTDNGRLSAENIKSRCSSVVEHFLGKEEVKSSILFNGSDF